MKKNDMILVAVILCAAIFLFVGNKVLRSDEGGFVTVTVDGEVYGTYDLSKEQKIRVHDTNTLVIKEGRADMTEATCPDKLCIHQKAIAKDGESIVCLPNQVIAEITSPKKSELDAVTN